jgi:hypothetical protein
MTIGARLKKFGVLQLKNFFLSRYPLTECQNFLTEAGTPLHGCIPLFSNESGRSPSRSGLGHHADHNGWKSFQECKTAVIMTGARFPTA